MSELTIKKKNETYISIEGSPSILQDISDKFTFFVENYKFMPAYKNKMFDGKIRLLKRTRSDYGEIYYGLLYEVCKVCKNLGYSYAIDDSLKLKNVPSEESIIDYCNSLNLHTKGKQIQLRDYQLTGVISALRNKRVLLKSPTSCMDINTIVNCNVVDCLGERSNIDITFDNIRYLHKNGFDIEVQTPFNYSKITDVYTKNGNGKIIVFTDGTRFTGADTHLVFNGVKYVTLDSLKISDILPTINHDYKIIKDIFDVYNKEWIDFSIVHESEAYVQNDIIHHNSGKSSIIYSISRYLSDNDLKVLIIVPSLNLVHQMYSDFIDYSHLNEWNVDDSVHKIYSGQEKNSNKNVVISTWQSLAVINKKQFSKDYFAQFDAVIIDEAHSAKAKEITSIVEKCINASYRIGLTGTLDNIKSNIKTITGLTGAVQDLISTKELMERGEVADFNIKCLVLKYEEKFNKEAKKLKYQDEIKVLTNNEKRNTFIKNLSLSFDKNALVLFHFVEHGKVLYDMIRNSSRIGDRKVYFISGETKGDIREEIRQLVEHEKNCIIVASRNILSQGVSINNLHNLVFAHPGKSFIKIIQACGRLLRLYKDKSAILYDIVDDLSYKSHENYALLHFQERVKMYDGEKFNYKLIDIKF